MSGMPRLRGSGPGRPRRSRAGRLELPDTRAASDSPAWNGSASRRRGAGQAGAAGLTPDRSAKRRAARRRARIEVALVAAAAVLALVVGWKATQSPGGAAAPDTGQSAQASSDSAALQVSTLDQVAVDRAEYDPTPFFGSYKSLHLYLPVPTDDLTEIGFHQASNKAALHISSLLPDADMTAASDKRGTGRQETTETVGPEVLTGAVLRMWRSNRSGPPDTAADVGAIAGTPVYAPVTGEVVQVRPYRLYDKYDDYEIHIRPNGWDEVDVVLIHVDSPNVKVGDRVVGGCTQVATVRMLSDRVTHQISEYTKDAGDHVHVQLNRIEVPGKLDFVGNS